MAELENTNPTMDNPGTNPLNPELEVSTPTTAAEPEQAPDFSQLFSENIADSTPIQETEPSPSIETPSLQPSAQEPVTPLEPINQPTEAPVQQEQTVNIEQEIANTSLDSYQNPQSSQEAIAAQKARIEQQKLAWLNEHKKKAKRSWLLTGLFLGIIIALLLLVAGVIFSKNYVLDAIDYIEGLIPTNNQNMLNKNNNQLTDNTEIDLPEIEETEIVEEETEMVEEENTEEVDEIQNYYNKVDKIIASESDEEAKIEQLRDLLTEVVQESEENNYELTQYISQTIMNLTINSEELKNEENDNTNNEENSEEEINDSSNTKVVEENNVSATEIQITSEDIDEEVDNTQIDENSNEAIKEENEERYTITHVDSEEEANWVMPSHCSDLTCYGEDKEFTECTSFRMDENLDENSHRIGNGWGCRYKDASELVYVKFN